MGMYDILVVGPHVRCVYCSHSLGSLQTKDLECMMSVIRPGESVRELLVSALDYGAYREGTGSVQSLLEKPFFTIEAYTFCERCSTWHEYAACFEQWIYTGDLILNKARHSYVSFGSLNVQKDELNQLLTRYAGLVFLFTDAPLHKRSKRRQRLMDWLVQTTGHEGWLLFSEVYAPTITKGDEVRLAWFQTEGVPLWLLRECDGLLPQLRYLVGLKSGEVSLYEPLIHAQESPHLGKLWMTSEAVLVQEGRL